MTSVAGVPPAPSAPAPRHRSNPWRQELTPPPTLAPVPNRKAEHLSPPAPPAPAAATSSDTFTIGAGTGGGTPNVPPGVYRVRCADVCKETGDNPFQPGTQRTVFLFHFTLADDPAGERGSWRWYTGTSKKSEKLGTVQRALKFPDTFKKSDVIGKECQALIEENARGYAAIKNLFPLP